MSLTSLLKVWDIVFEAQTQSIHQLRANQTAASVDIAARDVISKAGYGDAFTHRVGHGIGIKGKTTERPLPSFNFYDIILIDATYVAHESPYMNKGNFKSILEAGMAFTSEPGIYLVDEFGVRHEDVLLVQGEDVDPVLLTGQRAKGPWDP
jgi:Xaa-Pro aminopeptidase